MIGINNMINSSSSKIELDLETGRILLKGPVVNILLMMMLQKAAILCIFDMQDFSPAYLLV